MARSTPLLQKARAMVTAGDARTVKARKNVLGSLVVKGGSIVINFMMVPLMLGYLDPQRYGLWLTLTAIVAWFSFFDAGLGNGLRNKLAEALATQRLDMARSYVSTAYACLTLVSAALALVFFGAAWLIDWSRALNAPPELAGELRLLVQVVMVGFCLQFVLKLITMILLANQLTAFSNAINLGANALSFLGIWLLMHLYHQGDLLAAGWVITLAPVLVMGLASLWLFSGRFSDFAPRISSIQWGHARSLLGLGVNFFLLQLGGIFMFYSANLVITHLLGPAEVTRYNVAWRYFDVTAMAASIVLSPLWSASTDAWHSGDHAWLTHTLGKVHRIVALFAGGTLFLLVVAPWVMPIWLKDRIEIPMALLVSMAAFKACYIAIMPYNYLLNGLGKVRLQVRVTLMASVATVPLAIALVKVFHLGSEGVVLAILLCFLPILLTSRMQFLRVVNGRATGIWNQ